MQLKHVFNEQVEHDVYNPSNIDSNLIVSVTTVILVLATCMKLTVISYILPKDR